MPIALSSYTQEPREVRFESVMFAIVCVLCVVAMPTSDAFAQQSTVEPMEPELRRNEFMATAHARAIFAPKLLLDLWFEEHANTWSGDQRNISYGGHFTWRLKGDYELGVGIDWADLSMPAQYWKQNNEEIEDADFTTLDLKMLSVVFTTYWYWDPVEWLSPYVGVGIGAAYLAGSGIVDYQPVRGTACDTQRGTGEEFTPEACYGEDGEADPSQVDLSTARPAERMPPVVPVIHVAGGLRFNIYRYGVAKLEVGFNDYTYVGLSLGGQWW